MSGNRRRVDVELVRRGLVESREAAREMIAADRVTVAGVPVTKPARQVLADSPIKVAAPGREYASRGAYKLLGALEQFQAAGLARVAGRMCLDAGASTGGFTDVLIQQGAEQVLAIDVGYGQMVWSLASNERVTVMDRTNIRTLEPADIPYSPDLVVADLSFISLTKVLPALTGLAVPEADLLLMVKPQFEVGRSNLGKKGVVRDPVLRADAIEGVASAASKLGWSARDVVASPLPGPSGNVEYFIWLQRSADPVDRMRIEQAVAEGPQ